MIQDREGLSRLDTDTFVAARMCIDPSATEDLICLNILIVQRISGTEAINER
jgi:hypothetical protein